VAPTLERQQAALLTSAYSGCRVNNDELPKREPLTAWRQLHLSISPATCGVTTKYFVRERAGQALAEGVKNARSGKGREMKEEEEKY